MRFSSLGVCLCFVLNLHDLSSRCLAGHDGTVDVSIIPLAKALTCEEEGCWAVLGESSGQRISEVSQRYAAEGTCRKEAVGTQSKWVRVPICDHSMAGAELTLVRLIRSRETRFEDLFDFVEDCELRGSLEPLALLHNSKGIEDVVRISLTPVQPLRVIAMLFRSYRKIPLLRYPCGCLWHRNIDLVHQSHADLIQGFPLPLRKVWFEANKV